VCGANIENDDSYHFLTCHKYRIKTHDLLVYELKHMIHTAGFKVESEKLGVYVFPGRCIDNNLRVDLLSTSAVHAQSIVGDVTIRHPHSPPSSTVSMTDALTQAETSKINKYKALCDDSGHKFEVYAFDHYGRMSRDVQTLLNRLKKHARDFSDMMMFDSYNWAAPSFKAYWRQRISCSLQKFLGQKELLTMQESHLAHGVTLGTDARHMFWSSYGI
jgi:hypothetical protein